MYLSDNPQQNLLYTKIARISDTLTFPFVPSMAISASKKKLIRFEITKRHEIDDEIIDISGFGLR